MSTRRQRLPSYLAALLLGGALGVSGSRRGEPLPDYSLSGALHSRPSSPASSVTEDLGLDPANAGSRPAGHSSDPYAAAWQALKRRGLPMRDRQWIEGNLLLEWSRTDLPAALHAALSNPSREQNELLEGIMRDQFKAVPVTSQDPVLAAIHQSDFGWKTGKLYSLWEKSRSTLDMETFVGLLDQIPQQYQPDLIASALYKSRNLAGNQQNHELLLDHLAGLPAPGSGPSPFDRDAQFFSMIRDEPDLRREFVSRDLPTSRRFYRQAYALHLQSLPEPQRLDLLAVLPADLRAEVEATLEALPESLDH